MWILPILFMMLSQDCIASVVSTQGTIHFDIQSDDIPEMTLNSTGLGIGVVPSSSLTVEGNAILSGQLIIGGTTTTSNNLHIHGSMSQSYQMATDNITLGAHALVLADSSGGNLSLTLPYAANVSGQQFTIKQTSRSYGVWLSGGGNTIDVANEIKLISYSGLPVLSTSDILPYAQVISDGSKWHIIKSSGTLSLGNLIGWWKLDETSGNTVYDYSGFDRHGTLMNGLELSASTTDGHDGKAITFDGVDDYIDVGEYDIPSGNLMTISCWWKSSHTPGVREYALIVSKTHSLTSSNNPYTIGTRIERGFGGFDGTRIETADNKFNNTWNHSVIVINDNLFSHYHNGVHQGDQAFTLIENDQSTNIGSHETKPTSRPFNGEIDDVRIYDTPLSAEQILQLYNGENLNL